MILVGNEMSHTGAANCEARVCELLVHGREQVVAPTQVYLCAYSIVSVSVGLGHTDRRC